MARVFGVSLQREENSCRGGDDVFVEYRNIRHECAHYLCFLMFLAAEFFTFRQILQKELTSGRNDIALEQCVTGYCQ